jgi:flavin reductase (DIM6/NTAB) family NADH-FMN oxidoreductase RutF
MPLEYVFSIFSDTIVLFCAYLIIIIVHIKIQLSINRKHLKGEYSMKKKLGPVNCLYPMPVTLVGATVNGKPNFLAIAHVGIMNHAQPAYISVSLNKMHYTNAGIKENGTFSVNIPSEDMVVETDFCGIASGKTTDKSSLFELFAGELKTAPMITKCPLNIECRLHDIIDFPTHEVFIGEIVASYGDDDILSNDAVDMLKVKPMLFDMGRKNYWKLGEPFAQCWHAGKQLMHK